MSEREPRRPDSLPAELKGFEASLAALVPTAPNVDRDRLMFEAGRASRRSVVPWSIALVSCAACCAMIALTLLPAREAAHRDGLLTVRGETAVSNSIVRDVDAAARLAEPDSYLQLRRHAAEAELAAVLSSPRAAAAPITADRDSLLRELLN